MLGFWYLLGPMRAYMQFPLAFMQNTGALWLVSAGVVGFAIVPRLLARPAIGRFVHTVLPATLAIVMAALAAYAYFFRVQAGRLALADAMAFRAFAWYVSTPVLALAVAGFAWFVWRRFWRAPAFFVTLSLFSVFFFYKIRIAHEHFWASRRLLPVILPGALLLATALLDSAIGRPLWARLRALSPSGRGPAIVGAAALATAALPIAVVFWRATSPVAHHVEYAGLIPQIERLSTRFGDRDLVLLEGRNAGSDLHVFGMPLAYIYARNVLVLDSPVPSKRLLEGFVHWARSRYDNVWFLGGGGTDLLTATVKAEPISSEKFRVPEYATAENAYPVGVRQKEFDYGIYRLVPSDQPGKGPIDLQIGDKDDVNVVRFHAKEFRADIGLKYRWTGPLSVRVAAGDGSRRPDAHNLDELRRQTGPRAGAGRLGLTRRPRTRSGDAHRRSQTVRVCHPCRPGSVAGRRRRSGAGGAPRPDLESGRAPRRKRHARSRRAPHASDGRVTAGRSGVQEQERQTRLVERSIWIVGAVLLAGYLLGTSVFFRKPEGRVVVGDATHHFVQLRSLVFDRDLQFRNEYVRLYGLSGGERDTEWIFSDLTPTGHVRNYMPVGPALLWAPLYLVGVSLLTALSWLGLTTPPDGFEHVLQLVPGVTGVLATTMAALMTWRLTRRWTTPAAAAIATLSVWLGSHALYLLVHLAGILARRIHARGHDVFLALARDARSNLGRAPRRVGRTGRHGRIDALAGCDSPRRAGDRDRSLEPAP